MQTGVRLAIRLVQGCDHAGITLVHHAIIESGAASDSVVDDADAILHELRGGPCVDLARSQDRLVYIADLTRDSRWPTWALRAAVELQVGSLLAVRLYTHERSYGALNLYADHGHAFSADDFDVAVQLAAQLAVAIADGQEIEARGRDLNDRTILGQAQGILMERYGMGSAQALAFLRRAAQDSNRELSVVAHRLVVTRDIPEGGPDPRLSA